MSIGALAGKTAIVTGSSRGIGKQIALDLARQGANVVVAARTVEPRKRIPGTISDTVEAIEALGVDALAVQADMAVEADLVRLVAATMDRFGRVDVLVNNAAATADRSWGAPLTELTREDWQRQFDINLNAPFSLIREVLSHMTAQGSGRIINITTGTYHGGVEGPTPGVPNPLAYPSSKAALNQFCKSVAFQLKEVGIAIVNVNPGFVRTEMVEIMAGGDLDGSEAIPMDIPMRVVTYLATCDKQFEYSGTTLNAEDLILEIN